MSKTVLVCGSRTFKDKDALWSALYDEMPINEIIEGGALGADRIGRKFGEYNDVFVTTVNAEWENYGKSAGFIRNSEMIDRQPDVVIAGWDGRSRGALDTITKAAQAGIPVRIVPDEAS